MTALVSARSCCEIKDAVADPGVASIALVGAPNVGKSTLFNALTGAQVATGNWPGTSVAVARGLWRSGAANGLNLIDLPGAFSLDPLSEDERLTRDLLLGADHPDLTVVIVDAANLARSLYLVAQARDHGLRMVVAVTMLDVASQRGIRLDTEALSVAVGSPVVALDPRRRSGMAALSEVVVAALDQPAPTPTGSEASRRATIAGEPCDLAVEDARFTWIEDTSAAATTISGQAPVSLGDRIDRWVLAPVFGPLIFLAAMWLVFQLTTTVAAPLQGALSAFFSGPVAGLATALISGLGFGDTWVQGFVIDGLVAGVGMVLTFVPLMAIMFVLLSLLEDSGYLARAAVVTDRLMRRIGLPGQAFLPLVVGFGCNVPAIAATRILPDARQRLLTALLVPFTSCTARLTVYMLLGTIFFGRWAGTVVFVLYLVSIMLVIGVGLALRKTLWRTMGQQPLVLDLPAYQRPTLRLTLATSWHRLQGFLHSAAGIIVVVVVVVWVLQAIPASAGVGTFGSVDIADSVYAQLAGLIAPVFAFAGFADWRIVSGLVVGFVAKEAVISSWALTYPAGDAGLWASFEASSGGDVLPAVAAFLVFFLAYTPCVATLAAQRREIGTKWTVFGFAVQLVVAWTAAVLVFQIGRLML